MFLSRVPLTAVSLAGSVHRGAALEENRRGDTDVFWKQVLNQTQFQETPDLLLLFVSAGVQWTGGMRPAAVRHCRKQTRAAALCVARGRRSPGDGGGELISFLSTLTPRL